MAKDLIYLFLITLIPALELRASIPFGVLHQKHALWLVAVVCIVANILLGIVWFLCIAWGERQLERLPFFHKLWLKFCERAQKKIKPKVDKYGVLGVAVFIGIPLPGSGVYTGGVGAYLLGMRFKQFVIANVLGVLIAGSAVSGVVYAGPGTFGWLYDFFLKPPAELIDEQPEAGADTPENKPNDPSTENDDAQSRRTTDPIADRPALARSGRQGRARPTARLRPPRVAGQTGMLRYPQDRRHAARVPGQLHQRHPAA